MKRHSEEGASHLGLWELKNVITVVHSSLQSSLFILCLLTTSSVCERQLCEAPLEFLLTLWSGLLSAGSSHYRRSPIAWSDADAQCWPRRHYIMFSTLHARSSMSTHFRRSKQLMFVKTRSKVNDAHPSADPKSMRCLFVKLYFLRVWTLIL